MSPRPILKRSPSSVTHHDHHAVHFPPSPSLTRTFEAHCPSTYDRSPIVVLPNSCALPERGCPGRTYAAVESPSSQRSKQISNPSSPPRSSSAVYAPKDLHPRAFSRQYEFRGRDSCSSSTPMGPFSPPPPLIPDLSSESEESDGFTSPAPESTLYTPSSPRSSSHRSSSSKHPQHPSASPYDLYAPTAPIISPTAAFPTSHLYNSPPSPSHSSHGSSHAYHHPPEDVQLQKARRRRDRERKRERSRERDRIRGVIVEEDEESEAALRSTPRVRPSSSSSCYKPLASAFSSLSITDADGCLGGF